MPSTFLGPKRTLNLSCSSSGFNLPGFHGYGYFQAAAPGQAQTNGGLMQADRPNGNSSYYEYTSVASNQPARTDAQTIISRDSMTYGRSTGEIISGQLTSQMTPGTNTPALVAQALSGNNRNVSAINFRYDVINLQRRAVVVSCGSIGRVVASDTRDLRFKSRHWQNFIYQLNNR